MGWTSVARPVSEMWLSQNAIRLSEFRIPFSRVPTSSLTLPVVDRFAESKQTIQDYVNDRLLLLKLEMVEKTSKLVSVMFIGLLITILSFFILSCKTKKTIVLLAQPKILKFDFEEL